MDENSSLIQLTPRIHYNQNWKITPFSFYPPKLHPSYYLTQSSRGPAVRLTDTLGTR